MGSRNSSRRGAPWYAFSLYRLFVYLCISHNPVIGINLHGAYVLLGLPQRTHNGGRPANANSMVFLFTGTFFFVLSRSFFPMLALCCWMMILTGDFDPLILAVLLLFMILNSHQMSPNFLVSRGRGLLHFELIRVVHSQASEFSVLGSCSSDLAGAGCFLYGDNYSDVCNLPAAPCPGASPCCCCRNWFTWSF